MLTHKKCISTGLATVLLMPLLVGCTNNVKKWEDEANQRWLGIRSKLMLQMAQQAFDSGDLKKAESDLKNALRMDQTNPTLHILACRIALERSELERAFLHFNGAIELDDVERPRHADTHYYQGIVLQRWQRYDDALARYEAAYKISPDHAPYLTALCEMLVELNRTDEAIELLESKLTYFDQSTGVRSALGHMYRLKGEHKRSAEYFYQAALLDSENMVLREEYARSLYDAGAYEVAIKGLEFLINEPQLKGRVDLNRMLGQAYIQANCLGRARQVYQDLTRGGGENGEDWIQLAQISWREGDLGATLSTANRVIRLLPNRYEGYLLAGMVWNKRGRLDDALRNFDRAAGFALQDPVPLVLRGLALQKAGHKKAAAESYSLALRRQPDNQRAKQLLQTLLNNRSAAIRN